MFAEDSGGLLDIHVGVGNGAQRLNESARRLRVRADESGSPGGRRRSHIVGAAMHQQSTYRQIGELHDAIGDTGKIQSDRCLLQGLWQKRCRRVIGTDANQHGRAQNKQHGVNAFREIGLRGRPAR